jgi:hypothetical protein
VGPRTPTAGHISITELQNATCSVSDGGKGWGTARHLTAMLCRQPRVCATVPLHAPGVVCSS